CAASSRWSAFSFSLSSGDPTWSRQQGPVGVEAGALLAVPAGVPDAAAAAPAPAAPAAAGAAAPEVAPPVAAAPGAVPVAAGADAAEGAVDGVSSRVTVLVSVPSGWVAVGIGAAWSESYVAAGATAVTPLRDVSGDGFNACCAGVSGSGIRASTRCASGDGDVLSITVATGVTTGTGACSACVPVVDVAGG